MLEQNVKSAPTPPVAICKSAENNVIAVATYPCIFNQSLMLSSALHPVVSLQPWARPEVDCRVGVSAYATQPLRIPRSYESRLS